jgi:L,D-transpeptidase YbiS
MDTTRYQLEKNAQWVWVDVAKQTLRLMHHDCEEAIFRVSTAKNGLGCRKNSFCTPTGLHRIRLKIGAGCHPWQVFVARRPPGEIYQAELAKTYPERDWILGRILWLQGIEPGINRGADIDTLKRFVYIHGTADTAMLGTPCSHGCIRMHPQDMVTLFDVVAKHTPVWIR